MLSPPNSLAYSAAYPSVSLGATTIRLKIRRALGGSTKSNRLETIDNSCGRSLAGRYSKATRASALRTRTAAVRGRRGRGQNIH
jgi:hypothetical protein